MHVQMEFAIPLAAIVAGGGLAIVWLRRTQREIAPGLFWRVVVSVYFLAVGLALAATGGTWVAFLMVALALGALVAARALIAEARAARWHWPTVVTVFVLMPTVVAVIWGSLHL